MYLPPHVGATHPSALPGHIIEHITLRSILERCTVPDRSQGRDRHGCALTFQRTFGLSPSCVHRYICFLYCLRSFLTKETPKNQFQYANTNTLSPRKGLARPLLYMNLECHVCIWLQNFQSFRAFEDSFLRACIFIHLFIGLLIMVPRIKSRALHMLSACSITSCAPRPLVLSRQDLTIQPRLVSSQSQVLGFRYVCRSPHLALLSCFNLCF